MAKLFLGVDGGQSSTTALIGDEAGRVVGFGRGGPCNHVGAAEGRAKFLNAIGGCLGEALKQAGAEGPRFEGACLGFSGGPADKEALVRELLTAEHLFVTHDALIGQVGACAGEPGLITIAGTGRSLWPECGGAHRTGRRLGLHLSAMKAARSISCVRRCARLCDLKKVGDRRRVCARCCLRPRVPAARTRCCTRSTRRNGRGSGWRRCRRWSTRLRGKGMKRRG
jgi:hypothetical protein